MMIVCPHCGKKHPAEAKFCPFTTKPLPQVPEAVPDTPPAGGLPPWLSRVAYPLGILLIAAGAILSLASIARWYIAKPAPLTAAVSRRSAADLWPGPVVQAAQISAATTTPTSIPTATPLPPTPTATATLTPTPAVTNPKDSAVLVEVPAGKFVMGSDPAQDPYFWGAESPQHNVTLKAFWIYQTEVTNSLYQACVKAKACPLPQRKTSRTRSSYYDDPQYANYPVIFVTYVSATAYCQWAGGRLPTEAEWEKAARGDQDLRLFPWGDTPANDQQANFSGSGPGDTLAVGSFPSGVSPYGALDMAGNVWEWVFDYFQPGYSKKDAVDPIGPASSTTRVIRGGSWDKPAIGVRAVQRTGLAPSQGLDTVGFRCVVEEK